MFLYKGVTTSDIPGSPVGQASQERIFEAFYQNIDLRYILVTLGK